MKFLENTLQALFPIPQDIQKTKDISSYQIREKFFKVIIARKKGLKNLHLRLSNSSTIKISCSLRATFHELEKIIKKNERWILQKSQEFSEKEKHTLTYEEGEHHLWNGKSFPLRIIWQNEKRARLLLENNEFRAYLSQSLSPNQSKKEIERLFKKFYQQQTMNFCQKRLKELQQIKYFPFKNIKIKKLKSRWGSCSKQGNMNFNQDLAKISEPMRNYIIAHEYAHLKELNHSKKFWEIVKFFEPDYSQIKRELKLHEKKYH